MRELKINEAMTIMGALAQSLGLLDSLMTGHAIYRPQKEMEDYRVLLLKAVEILESSATE